MKKPFKITLIIIIVWIVLAAACSTCESKGDKEIANKSKQEVKKEIMKPVEIKKEEPKQIEVKKEEIKPIETPKIETPKEYTFSNGNYECGSDFEEGKYDIIAIEGGGNVMCHDNGLNTILGTKSEDDAMGGEGFYKQDFKNSRFKKGNTLEIIDVTIKLIKK